jgi:hypothetical protein
MVDEVGADGVVKAEFESDFEFGADAVCGADEDGILESLKIEPEKSAEATDAAEDVAVECLLSEIFDAFLGAVSGRDVDASVGVGQGFSLRFGRFG